MTCPESRAAEVIDHVGDEPSNVVAAALATEGLLTPGPQIIRTRDELATLDPDTIVTNRIPHPDGVPFPMIQAWHAPVAHRLDLPWGEPLVVIATGDQTRAEIAPFAATIAALHHELADKDVPLESAHLYVTKWIESAFRWAR